MKNTIRKIHALACLKRGTGNPFVLKGCATLRGIRALKTRFCRVGIARQNVSDALCKWWAQPTLRLKNPLGGQKGFILILALITMLAMSLIGISLLMNITTDTMLSRNEREFKMAFQLAEAGISEGSARIHLPAANANYAGELPTDAGYRTPAWAGHSFNSSAATLGAVGANRSYAVTITYLDETNPEGFCDSNNAGVSGANSSVGTDPNYALTFPSAWNCQNSPVEIVMYGQDFKIPPTVATSTYGIAPAYKIHSVGTSNGATVTVDAYVGANKLNTNANGAINSNACVAVNGQPNVVTGGTIQGPGCACDPTLSGGCLADKTATTDLNTFLGDTLANIKTYADQVLVNGNIGNWGTQANPQLIYIDNEGGADATIAGNNTGWGILIVTGNLKVSGSTTWNGLVYVKGTVTISGSINVDGAMMSGGIVQMNGSIVANYNQANLATVSKPTGTTNMFSWKKM